MDDRDLPSEFPGDSHDTGGDESLDGVDLEAYAEVDRLTEAFRAQQSGSDALSASEFAAQHPDLRTILEPALLAMDTLRRAEKPSLGRLRVGDRVGRFMIVGELGHGGMGVVYEATEEGLPRTVALKVLDADIASPAFRSRFVREARAAAHLEHPAIVPVYGTGEDGTLLWYAMRRIDGQALDGMLRQWTEGETGRERDEAEQRLLRAANVSSADVSGTESAASGSSGGSPLHVAIARIGQKLSSALAYAHDMGILHRDVKPGNVLLDRAGQPHLTDFGLCRLEGDASITEAADMIGTLRYMPPEALRQEVDQRGDVYGLGLILYELLGKRPAYARTERARLIHDIEHLDPPPLRRVDPSIPRDLESVVMKAIAKLPEERYGTAEAFSTDLAAFLAGKPIQARPQGLAYMLRLLFRRHRAAALVAMAATLLAIGGAAAYVVQLKRLLGEVEVARADAERRSALTTTRFAHSQLEDGDIGGTQQLLRTVPEKDRDWAWQHLQDRTSLPAPPKQLAIGHPLEVHAIGEDAGLMWAPQAVQIFDPVKFRRRAEVSATVQGAFAELGDSFTGAVPTGKGSEVLMSQSASRGDDHRLLLWEGHRRASPQKVVALRERSIVLRANPVAGVAAAVSNSFIHRVALEDTGVRDLGAEPVPFELEVQSMEILDNGSLILGSRSGEVWRVVPDGKSKRLGRHQAPVTALLVEGEELLASGDESGSILFYPFSGPGVARGLCEVPAGVKKLALGPPGEIYASLASGQIATLDRGGRVMQFARTFFISPAVGTFRIPGEKQGEALEFALSDNGRLQVMPRAALPGVCAVGSAVAFASKASPAPDGSAVAFTAYDGHLHVIGEKTHRVPSECNAASATFRDDGQLVAAAGLVINVETGEEVLRWWPPEGECTDSIWIGTRLAMFVWWSPEGMIPEQRRIDLWTWDSSTPGVAPRFEATLKKAAAWYSLPFVRQVPGSTDFVMEDADGFLQRFELEGGKPVWAEPVEVGRNFSLTIDTDRGYALMGGTVRGIVAVDLAVGAAVDLPLGQLGALAKRGARFLGFEVHGGAGRAVTVDDEGVLRMWTYPRGEEILRHEFGEEFAHAVSFTANGDGVLAATRRGTVHWLGVQPMPDFYWRGGAFADPAKMVAATIERLRVPDPPMEARVSAGYLLRAVSGTHRWVHEEPWRSGPIGQLRELVLRDIDADAFDAIVPGSPNFDDDVFGRFGFLHRDYR